MKIELSSSIDSPLVINGKATAQVILSEIRKRAEREQIRPGLAVILVGFDAASAVYVLNKGLQAKACGFLSRQYDLPEETSETDVLSLIAQLNDDSEIHGILVQLPLPQHIDTSKVIQAINPLKDVDGFHYMNVGHLMTGNLHEALIPCTPSGALILIHQVLGENLSGKHAVIVGRSNIVGKPMASLLLQQNCTVTIVHSHTLDPASIARQADILIAAVGVAKLVTAEWIKPGAVVIDVGINRVEIDGKSHLVGDVDYEGALTRASAITPVPGGVGPMTIALLMRNTLDAGLRLRGQNANP